MTIDFSSSHKTQLLRVLDDAEGLASHLQVKGQDLVRQASFYGDLAETLREVVNELPNDSAVPTEVWLRLTDGWKTQNTQAQALSDSLAAGPEFSASTQATALTTTVSVMMTSDWIARPTGPTSRLTSLLQRPSLIEEVRSAMQVLRLDRAHSERRSPLQLLEDARLALTRPSGPTASASGVLLPARESISATLADLLRRRIKQEPASSASAKVISIGAQCGMSSLPLRHFEQIGADVQHLLDRLSEAKQRDFAQPETIHLFDSTLQFHRTFLGSLDPSKCRS